MMDNLKISASSEPQAVIEKITQTTMSDHVSLYLIYPGMPALRVFLSGPKGFMQKQDHSLPSLFIMAGFFTGAYNTLLLGEVPGTVVVSFDYPYPMEAIVQDPAKLLQTFRLTPGAIALGLKWLSKQSWRNAEKSLVMGVSLGGLFLPASLQMAQALGVATPRTVFAFTGADMREMLGNLLKNYVPEPLLQALLVTVPTANVLSDPKIHLSTLPGRFLVISADQDQIIPRSSTELLFHLLPSPKAAAVLPGAHINYDQKLQIERTKETILKWLQQDKTSSL